MKIKEVLEKTGLTDRAVRFYIESGLVFPEHKENYAGRRSFEFSEKDVKRLSDIALLRAAGFSIEQIGKLFAGEDPRAIVEERLNALREERESGEKTALALSPLREKPELNVGMILDALKSEPVPRAVPKSDSAPPYKKILRRVIIAAVAVTVASALIVCFFGALLIYSKTGITRVSVRENGKLLTVSDYTVKQSANADRGFGEYHKSPLNRYYGTYYYAFTDYGVDEGTVILKDGFEIRFGFFNSNNWHKVQIFIDIERGPSGGKVRQTVVIPLEGTTETETEFSEGDSSCSVASSDMI